MASSTSEISFVGDDDSTYFRRVFDRSLNVLNPVYMLPADYDEVKASLHLIA